MGSEELLHGFGRGNIGATGCCGAKKLEELGAIAGGEAGGGVAYVVEEDCCVAVGEEGVGCGGVHFLVGH